MSELPEYVLEREFHAPQAVVWRAWTEPDLLAQWYGPGVETVIHEFDLQPGGCWLNEMKFGENSNYQKVVFQEVDPPEKLVWHHYSSTDKDWVPAANAMMPNWPNLLLTTVTFTSLETSLTRVRLSQVPLQASAEELAFFAEHMANMDGGWGQGYALIDELLKTLSAD